VNRTRHQFLACSRFAVDQDASVSRRYYRDLFAQRAHRDRLANHRVLARERRGHVCVHELEALLAQGVAHGQNSLLDREWFFDEVKRAELRRAHGSLDVAVTGDDHDRGFGTCGAELLQCFESVDAGEPYVEQDAAVRAFAKGFQTLFTTRDGVGNEAFILHHRAECVANAAFVVNDEYRIHLSIR
jgi:hypothetical protein